MGAGSAFLHPLCRGGNEATEEELLGENTGWHVLIHRQLLFLSFCIMLTARQRGGCCAVHVPDANFKMVARRGQAPVPAVTLDWPWAWPRAAQRGIVMSPRSHSLHL